LLASARRPFEKREVLPVNVVFHRPPLTVRALLRGRGGARNPFPPDFRFHGIFRSTYRLHGMQRVRAALAPGKFKYAEFATRQGVPRCHFEPAPHKGALNWGRLDSIGLDL
jgi:hypothetical protein